MNQIVKDLLHIFNNFEKKYNINKQEEDSDDVEANLQLWGDKNFGIFGKNYAEDSENP